MKIEDLQLKAARLLIERETLAAEATELEAAATASGITEELPELLEAWNRVDKAEVEILNLTESCAADPMIAPFMLCWIIDVDGKSDMTGIEKMTDEQIKELAKSIIDKPADFAAMNGGLMSQVRTAIEEEIGLPIREIGSGGGRWHVGVPCDETEALMICHHLHVRFHRAIESGMLTVRKRFWRWRFRACHNADAARKMLARHNEFMNDYEPDEEQ